MSNWFLEELEKERKAKAPPIFLAPRHWKRKITRAYMVVNGFIFVAAVTGNVASAAISYQNLQPVLRKSYGDSKALADRLINDKLGYYTDTTTGQLVFSSIQKAQDLADLKTYFVRADNFFVFKGRAWFATRFKLLTGILTDGINFNDTITQVQGVPRQDANPTAFEARYHHILKAFVYGAGPYTMVTEEQIIKEPNKSASNSNFHVVLNEYTSTDLDNWAFNRILAEDTNSSASSGLYAGYLRILKPAKYEHIKFDVLGQPQYQVTNLPIGYQRPKLHHFKITKGDKFYAYWTHALGDRQVYESTDGLNWTKKAVTIKGNKQGDILL